MKHTIMIPIIESDIGTNFLEDIYRAKCADFFMANGITEYTRSVWTTIDGFIYDVECSEETMTMLVLKSNIKIFAGGNIMRYLLSHSLNNSSKNNVV